MWIKKGTTLTRLTALVATGMAIIVAGSAFGDGPQKNRVAGSAKFGFAHVWIEAHSDANGMNARGRFRLQQGSGDWIGRVTGLNVVGNRAVACGVITKSNNSTIPVGSGFIQYFEDNGSPGSQDRSRTVFVDAPPVVCPPPTRDDLFRLNRGNYVVEDN